MNHRIVVLIVILTIQGISLAQKQPPSPAHEQPSGCEENEARLDQIAGTPLKNDEFIILTARLGNGEQSAEVSRRRLHNIREYLLLRNPKQLRWIFPYCRILSE